MTGERHLRAMGTDCHLVVAGPPDPERVLDTLAARLADLEDRWSRFRPGSDVSAIARARGEPVRVHRDTALLVERMLEARRHTRGWYDPTMHTELRALGYDRDLALLPAPPAAGSTTPAPPAGGSATAVATARAPVPVALDGDRVTVPAGHGLDPGSIGKGLAADLLVDLAAEHGATGALVNLGGDVRALGREEDGAPWGVVIAGDAHDGAPSDAAWDHDRGTLLGLIDAAVATSTVLRRRWATPGGTAHHLLDPRSGTPTQHDLQTVTVVAAEGWWADAAATAVLAAGPADPRLVDELGLACRLTGADGTWRTVGDWDALVS